MNRIPRENEYTRTIVVGLGGTGVAAVRWAKHYVNYLAGGCVPPFVKFVGLDSDRQQTGKVDMLEPGTEFMKVGDFSPRRLLSHKGEDGYEHLEWFPEWVSPSQIHGGAHGVPHIGRLCYIHRRESHILPLMERKFRELCDPSLLFKTREQGYLLRGQNAIHIHIVTSICGGSGAGFLLDATFDLRFLSQYLSNFEPVVTAHLVLPEVFDTSRSTPAKNQHRRNAYCLLRHIDFLTRKPASIDVFYRNKRQETWEQHEALFDTCYFFNKNFGPGDEGLKKTQEMIGRSIASIILESTGTAITEQWDNLRDAYLNSDEVRIYSSYSVDAYTMPDFKEFEVLSISYLRQVLLAQFLKLAAEKDAGSAYLPVDMKNVLSKLQIPNKPQKPTLVGPPPADDTSIRAYEQNLDNYFSQLQSTRFQARYGVPPNFPGPLPVYKPKTQAALATPLTQSKQGFMDQIEADMIQFHTKVVAYIETMERPFQQKKLSPALTEHLENWKETIPSRNANEVKGIRSPNEELLLLLVGATGSGDIKAINGASEIERSILNALLPSIMSGKNEMMESLNKALLEDESRPYFEQFLKKYLEIPAIEQYVVEDGNVSIPNVTLNLESYVATVKKAVEWYARFQKAVLDCELSSIFTERDVHLIWDDTRPQEYPVPIDVVQLPKDVQITTPPDYRKMVTQEKWCDLVIMKTRHGYSLGHLKNYEIYRNSFKEYCKTVSKGVHASHLLFGIPEKSKDGKRDVYKEEKFWDLNPSREETKKPEDAQNPSSQDGKA